MVVGWGRDSWSRSRAIAFVPGFGTWQRYDVGDLGGGQAAGYRVNEYGHITGYARNAAGRYRAFFLDFWLSGQVPMLDLGVPAGMTHAYGSRINRHGNIIGYASDLPFFQGTYRAFLWRRSENRMQDIGSLSMNGRSYASGLNDRDQIVGTAESAPGVWRACLWEFGRVRDLNTLLPAGSGWELVSARGISNDGRIVGYGRRNGQDRAFLLTPPSRPVIATVDLDDVQDLNNLGRAAGTRNNLAAVWDIETGMTTTLPTPQGYLSSAFAINDAGKVAGDSGGEAAFWENGTRTDLGSLGGMGSLALAVNDQGDVAGWARAPVRLHAFLSSSTQPLPLQDLGTSPPLFDQSAAFGVNCDRVVVGQSFYASGFTRRFVAMAWTQASGIVDLPGGNVNLMSSDMAAFDISNAGWAVGFEPASATDSRPIRWSRNVQGQWQRTVLPTLSGIAAGMNQAHSVNNHGQIVGTSMDSQNRQRACLWEAGMAYDLNSLLPANSGWALDVAREINDRGEITGRGRLNGQQRVFLLTLVRP
jgi:probable HAF family extracellular repeat protein